MYKNLWRLLSYSLVLLLVYVWHFNFWSYWEALSFLSLIFQDQAVAVTSMVRQSLPPGKMITIGNLSKRLCDPLEIWDSSDLPCFFVFHSYARHLWCDFPFPWKMYGWEHVRWENSQLPFSDSFTLMSAASKPVMSTESWFLSTWRWISSRVLKWSPSGLQ